MTTQEILKVTTLSRELLNKQLDDYEIRIITVPDAVIPGQEKTAYGVFNRLTAVREIVNDSLPYAFAMAFSLQETLTKVAGALKDGNTIQVNAPDMPRVQ